jgi:hypothetical protein
MMTETKGNGFPFSSVIVPFICAIKGEEIKNKIKT